MLKRFIARDANGRVSLLETEAKPLYSGGSCLCVDGFQMLGIAGACLSCGSHPGDKIPDKELREEELILAHSLMMQSSTMEKEHEVPGHVVPAVGKQKELVLSPIYVAWDPNQWNGAAHISVRSSRLRHMIHTY